AGRAARRVRRRRGGATAPRTLADARLRGAHGRGGRTHAAVRRVLGRGLPQRGRRGELARVPAPVGAGGCPGGVPDRPVRSRRRLCRRPGAERGAGAHRGRGGGHLAGDHRPQLRLRARRALLRPGRPRPADRGGLRGERDGRLPGRRGSGHAVARRPAEAWFCRPRPRRRRGGGGGDPDRSRTASVTGTEQRASRPATQTTPIEQRYPPGHTGHVGHPDHGEEDTMLFTQYYLDCLSHASYLVADETTGRAVVVDPKRDAPDYLADAEEEGLTIEAVINTHFHADIVAGHLELADRTGAWIGYGRRAETDYPSRKLADGERIVLGDVILEVMETPGHTPESISILVYEHADD